MRKLRLVKVLVQPVFIIDDGKTLEELEHPSIAVPAAEWSTYSSERFPREARAFEAKLNEEVDR
jgi:hypothetical protein